ncbi:MAG: TIGR03663 family protein [Anaerolineae bacterium]
MELHTGSSFLDKPLLDLVQPDWEKAAYGLILLLAVVSRFWDLGARSISWDECTHALFSYYLYRGQGFTHDPMMHGPFLFHANALVYFLLGDSDYTTRIAPGLFGVFLVMSPLLLRRWLGRLGTLLASTMLLISPTILYYSRYLRNEVYIALWMVLLTAALFHFLEDRRPCWFCLGAAVLMLSLATKENAYFFGFAGLVFLVEVVLWQRVRGRRHIWLYVGGLALCALFAVVACGLGHSPPEGGETDLASSGLVTLLRALMMVLAGTLPAVLLSGTLIRSQHPRPSAVERAFRSLTWRNWLVALLLVFFIYALLFSAFFTSPTGLGTGILGSITYWLAQQGVGRGSQPTYYYGLLLLTYGFVPLLFGLLGLVYYLFLRPFSHSTTAADPEPASLDKADLSFPSFPLFVSFLIFWTLFSLFIYAWAGEKMPWMVVHQVVPLILLAAKFLGERLERVDWSAVWRRGGALLALLLPIIFLSLYSLAKPKESVERLAILFVVLLLLSLTVLVIRRLGGRYTATVVQITVLGTLSFFTLRFAWMAAYINYDYPTELLVYAHGGADVKSTMDEIAELSRRTVGDKQIEVAYDREAAWPLEWYLREYPNRNYYGDTPTRDLRDVPIVISSPGLDDRVRPLLGDRFYRVRRREIWWPSQQYMGLTWERIWNILASPEQREILWNILYYRQYPRTPDDWYHVDEFYLYVRKDVAQQLWDHGVAPPGSLEFPPDPYAAAEVELGVVRAWGELGVDLGQFNHPRDLAVGPKGDVYVVDSDNHRIQVFDDQGTFLRAWGSRCDLSTGQGCVDPDGDGPLAPGDGQFLEPWGVAVSGEGRVYVADTWNHRLQVFDVDGAFQAKWGSYGQTASDAYHLYGPRDVAVDTSSEISVTDTGNKRVVVYDHDGRLLRQWGGAGSGPGQFEEPVGLAAAPANGLNADGLLYVADTWNQRIQAFDSQGLYVRQWPVAAWSGASVAHKPSLAVDPQGRVYITDPEGGLVAVFSHQGALVATFGQHSDNADAFRLPIGIDLDASGYIYVTDTNHHRIVKLEPLP